MRIERAARADIPALCSLLAILFEQEAEFRPDAESQARGLRHIIDNPHIGAILLARDAGDVVGMVNLLFTVSTALGEPVAWLEDLVVAPTRRNAGTGSLLLSAAIALARENGCRRITLLTDASNEAAQRFYRRHGFEGSSMIPLRLALG